MKTFRMMSLLCLCLLSSAARAIDLRTVALTGDAAPGTAAGVSFSVFNQPVLNNSGNTLIRATLTGTGVTTSNDLGFWSEATGSLALVAREGDAAPGTPAGVVFGGSSPFLSGTFNNAGHTAFWGRVTGAGVTGSNEQGIWSDASGSLALVARQGNAAPGTGPGVVFQALTSQIHLNNAGQTAFEGFLSGTGVTAANDRGLWAGSGGSLSLVAREGDAAPGTPAGVVFSSTFGTPDLNNAGEIAFVAILAGTGVSSSNNKGIWSEAGGSLALVARKGDTAPDTPADFLDFATSNTFFNDAGQTAFRGRLTGAGVSSGNDTGIWTDVSGSLALVTREGDAAPDTAAGAVFSIFEPPVLNDAGQIAFAATLTGAGITGSNDTGIWSEGGGSLALVAREGDAAPGTPVGVLFDNFDVFNPSNIPMLNNNGQTAFLGQLTGAGVSASNDTGIWMQNAGVLDLLVREGDLLEVASGDFRTITGLQAFPFGIFNDVGEFAFQANFSDGSAGVFVASFSEETGGSGAIPEPSTFVLLMLGSLVLVRRKRKS